VLTNASVVCHQTPASSISCGVPYKLCFTTLLLLSNDERDSQVIFFFISDMHFQECVASNIDISLQSGQFSATSTASFRERLLDFRSCWIVFIDVVQGHPGGLLQFSKGEAVKILLASLSSGIQAMWPSREKCRAWIIAKRYSCLVVHLISLFHTWWYHLIPNSFCRQKGSRATMLMVAVKADHYLRLLSVITD